MAYDIRFSTVTTGSGDLDKITASINAIAISTRASAISLDTLTQGMGKTAAASTTLAGAHTQAAAATRALGAAHAGAVPQVAAASAAIRELGGALPIRAVERFAVNVLGLGPILQKAFPLIGAAAFGGIIVDVGEKLAAFFRKVREAPEAIKTAFEELNNALRLSNDQLQLSNDKLANNIAQLEHKPQNALAVALDEARVNADELAKSLDSDIGKVRKLFKENGVSLTRELLGESGTSELEAQIKGFQQRVDGITTRGRGRLDGAVDTKIGGVSLLSPGVLTTQKNNAESTTNTELKTALDGFISMLSAELRTAQIPGAGGVNPGARIELLTGALNAFKQQRDAIDVRTQHGALEGDNAAAEARKKDEERANEAARKRDELVKRIEASEDRGIEDPIARARKKASDEGVEITKSTTDPELRARGYAAAFSDVIRAIREEQKKQTEKIVSELKSSDPAGLLTAQIGEALVTGDPDKLNTLKPQSDTKTGRLFEEQLRSTDKNLTEANAEDKKTFEYENDRTKQSGASSIREIAQRGASADRQIDSNPELNAAQKIVALHQQDLATAREKYQADLEAANKLIEIDDNSHVRDLARHEARLKYLDEEAKLEEENQERLAKLEDERLSQFRTLIGGLFEAVANRQPNAIPNFVKSQVLGQAQKLTENAAQDYLWKPLQQAAPKLTGGIFAGTWLGGGAAGGDKTGLTKPVSDFATAVHEFATSVTSRATFSGSGGGFTDGAPGGPSLDTDAYGNAIPNIFSGGGFDQTALTGLSANLPTAAPGLTGLAKALSGFGSGASSVLSGNALATLLGYGTPGVNGQPGTEPTTAQQVGAGVGLAGAAATGAYGIYSGLKQGGVGGDLKAAGSAVGLGTSVAVNVAKALGDTLSSAIPIVGSIVALALPLIGGLFNGPQQRANAINTELGQAQYNAPQALNVTQSSGGTFTDFDARGNIRTSDFSAVPTVREGSTWEQTHGLFNGPPTFYQVPGGQTSQFGAPVTPAVQHVYNAPVIQGNLSAIDTQSGSDFIMKNHMTVGNAAATALQNSHGRFASEVQRTAAG